MASAAEDILGMLADLVAERVIARMAAPVTHYTTKPGGVHPPGKSRAWALRTVKAIPGARKVGRDWIISVEAYEAWLSEQDGGQPKAKAVNRLALDPRAIAQAALARAPLRPTR